MALRCGSVQPELLTEERVEWCKRLLWHIGREVDARTLDRDQGGLLAPQQMWAFVASKADHRLGGDKLQRMYETLKARGYQVPLRIGQQPHLKIPVGGESGALLVEAAGGHCHGDLQE
jgi:hypothetical protein